MAEHRTLVFCTSYVAEPERWNGRYRRWIDAQQRSGLRHDQLLIVDDGSATLPGWADTACVAAGAAMRSDSPVALYHFPDQLGRPSHFVFPGWYRSFAFAAQWAQAGGFSRVIHVESDAFLISPRAIAYFNAVEEGWIALYTQRYEMPEIAIQAMAGDGFARYCDYVAGPYSRLEGTSHEHVLPLTHVERGLRGDRYGEYLDHVPADADWATQCLENARPDYYWWLPEAGRRIACGQGRLPPGLLVSGWSEPEATFTWSGARDCAIALWRGDVARDHCLALRLRPATHHNVWPSQRVGIAINGHDAGRFVLRTSQEIELWVPWEWIAASDHVAVTLTLPDAITPASLVPTSGDQRLIAVALESVYFAPLEGGRDAGGNRLCPNTPAHPYA
jgi:hypothetical protein